MLFRMCYGRSMTFRETLFIQLGATPPKGRSPTIIVEGDGGAEPPPHIIRQSRAALDSESVV